MFLRVFQGFVSAAHKYLYQYFTAMRSVISIFIQVLFIVVALHCQKSVSTNCPCDCSKKDSTPCGCDTCTIVNPDQCSHGLVLNPIGVMSPLCITTQACCTTPPGVADHFECSGDAPFPILGSVCISQQHFS